MNDDVVEGRGGDTIRHDGSIRVWLVKAVGEEKRIGRGVWTTVLSTEMEN